MDAGEGAGIVRAVGGRAVWAAAGGWGLVAQFPAPLGVTRPLDRSPLLQQRELALRALLVVVQDRRRAAGRVRDREHARRAQLGRRDRPVDRQLGPPRPQFRQQRQHRDQLQQLRGPRLRPGRRADRLQRARLRPCAVRRANHASSTRTPPDLEVPGLGAVRGRCGRRRRCAGPPRRGRSASCDRAGGQRRADVGAAAAGQPGALAVARAAQPERAGAAPVPRPAPTLRGRRCSGTSHPAAAGPRGRQDPGEDVVGARRGSVPAVARCSEQPRREVRVRPPGPPVQRADPAGRGPRGSARRAARTTPGPRGRRTRGAAPARRRRAAARPAPATVRAGRRRSAGGRGSATARRRGRAGPVPGSGQRPVLAGEPAGAAGLARQLGHRRCAGCGRGWARTAPRGPGPRRRSGRPSGPSGMPASGAVGHPRPSRGGATDHGMRSSSSGSVVVASRSGIVRRCQSGCGVSQRRRG